MRTRDRIRELSATSTRSRRRERASSERRTNLDYLVTARKLDLPLAFESGGLRVYRDPLIV